MEVCLFCAANLNFPVIHRFVFYLDTLLKISDLASALFLGYHIVISLRWEESQIALMLRFLGSPESRMKPQQSFPSVCSGMEADA